MRDYLLHIRTALFRDSVIVEAVCATLVQLAGEEYFEISAYCFMLDHVHMLVEGLAPTSDLCRLIQRWKQKTGHAHRRAAGGHLWQGGYYDHVLREEEDRQAIIRYILANPLRAGLVSDVREYPFWGSTTRTRDELLTAFFASGEGRSRTSRGQAARRGG